MKTSYLVLGPDARAPVSTGGQRRDTCHAGETRDAKRRSGPPSSRIGSTGAALVDPRRRLPPFAARPGPGSRRGSGLRGRTPATSRWRAGTPGRGRHCSGVRPRRGGRRRGRGVTVGRPGPPPLLHARRGSGRGGCGRGGAEPTVAAPAACVAPRPRPSRLASPPRPPPRPFYRLLKPKKSSSLSPRGLRRLLLGRRRKDRVVLSL